MSLPEPGDSNKLLYVLALIALVVVGLDVFVWRP
jgi:hypothetical protein